MVLVKHKYRPESVKSSLTTLFIVQNLIKSNPEGKLLIVLHLINVPQKWQKISWDLIGISNMRSGIILCMHPANERRRYNIKSSLNGWVHTQYDPCHLVNRRLFKTICNQGMYLIVNIHNMRFCREHCFRMAWHCKQRYCICRPSDHQLQGLCLHKTRTWSNDDLMTQFSDHWPFVRGIHRSPVDSPHKGPVIWSLDDVFVVSLT